MSVGYHYPADAKMKHSVHVQGHFCAPGSAKDVLWTKARVVAVDGMQAGEGQILV
jgi:hypothetical protein